VEQLLPEITDWKLIYLKIEKDVTAQYQFTKGWIITSRSVIYLLEQLRNLGFKYLNLRNLNQDLKIFFVRHGNIVYQIPIPSTINSLLL